MRYLLYLANDGDGMALVLIPEGATPPVANAQLVRAFASRQRALEAMDSLQQDFVLPVQRCLARVDAEPARSC
jgi:hypothetical protein